MIETSSRWITTSLASISKLVIGGDWGKDPSKTLELDGEYVEVSCIRGSEIKNWDKVKGQTAVKRIIKKNSCEKRKLQNGDIIIEISGGGPDQPVGRILYINDDVLIKFSSPVVCTNFLRLIRVYENLNQNFISYYLKHFYLSGEVVNYQGGSNNLRNLKYKNYQTIKIPIPPLAEQNRIVKKLDELFGHLDVLKERLDRIPQLLKDFRQSVLSQAVSGKLTEGTRIEKWRTVKLKDLVIEIKSGKSFSCPEIPVVSGKIGLVKISAVTWGEFDEKETKTVEDSDRIRPDYFIKKGDFLMSRANTLEKVGASVIVKKIVNKIMLSDKVWRVKFAEECDKKYINYFLRSDIGRREIESRASGNQVSMRNLSQSKFLDIDISLPSLSEQKQIVLKIESLFVKADKIKQYNIVLKEKINVLPQAILEKAFKGELVPQLKGDGSAEDLLKQIQVSKALENKKVVEKIKKKIKPVKMKDLIEIIELNFKSKYFTFEDIDQRISNISKAEYIKIKNEFFELLKKDKFSIEGKKLKSKLVKSKGVIQYKLESK